jgi:large subunit ribosomal protein L13
MFVQKSHHQKTQEITKDWFHIDATDLVLGRLATQVAMILRGKNKSIFTPTVDCGDFVVITNCEKIKLTGKKWDQKIYNWHTNHIGGIKSRTATEMKAIHPEKMILEAVKGMLPKNTIGRKQLTKLKVFQGEQHEHQAQTPKTITLNK